MIHRNIGEGSIRYMESKKSGYMYKNATRLDYPLLINEMFSRQVTLGARQF